MQKNYMIKLLWQFYEINYKIVTVKKKFGENDRNSPNYLEEDERKRIQV